MKNQVTVKNRLIQYPASYACFNNLFLKLYMCNDIY